MVDGILASCYPSTDHDLAQISILPMKWFPGLVELIFGDSIGMQTYVNILNDLGKWVSLYMLQN